VVTLPLVLPPTVLGFYPPLLIVPHGLVERLPFSFAGLIVISVFHSLPVVQSIQTPLKPSASVC
jgi:molybdate transport system permease protein